MANYIGNQPLAGEFKHLDSIASQFNGGTVTFSLLFNGVSQSAGDASQLIVSLNGVIQEPLTSYTLGTGGSTITFSSAPANGDTCFIIMLGGVGGTTTPSDNSVTTAKIASGAVTSAKLDTNIAISGTLDVGSYARVLSNNALYMMNTANDASSYIKNTLGTGAADLRLGVLGGDKLTILSSGNIGIGTDAPGNLLHVKSNINNGAVITVESTATDSYPFLRLKNDAREYQITAHGPLGDKFTIYDGTAGAHRFTIDTSGKVGIGTTSPSTPLHVYHATTNGVATFESGDEFGGIALKDNSTTEPVYLLAVGNELRIQTSTQERVRVDSNGRVGIGNTDPDALLDVAGEGVFSGTLHNALYADGDGIRVMGNESTVDIVGSDIGDHSSSLYIRNGTEGFAFINSPNDDAIHLRSFTSTADGFYAHAAGSNVSNLVNIATFERGGNVGIGTDNPGTVLHVYNTTQSRIAMENSTRRFDIMADGDGLTIRDQSAAVNRFRIDTSGNAIPTADAAYDLGSTSFRWNNVYTTDLQLSNMGKEGGNDVDGTTGNWTLQEGAEDLFIINNNTGKKYRIPLEEVV